MESSGSQLKAPTVVALPDPSAFDLETFASQYSERGLILRLLFVARSCPILSLEAYNLAIAAIKESSLDFGLYEQSVAEHNAALEGFRLEVASSATPSQAALNAASHTPIALDASWVKRTKDRTEKERDKLEVELKSYQSNVIKESIRMGHRDLANFDHKAGDLQTALRLHIKTRDFCSIPSHVVDMCLAVIEVAMETRNYAVVKNYVIKAEAALESAGAGATKELKSKSINMPGMVQGLSKKEEAIERSKTVIVERLAVAQGIAELGQGNFERSAHHLLRVTAGARLDDAQHYVSPADIALYAVFCGLATMDRQQLKRRLINNSEIRALLELEPWLKDLLAAFYDSHYQTFLSILIKHEARPALDLHLSFQLNALLPLIKNRAVVQYFQPFGSVSLAKMASAFGWSNEAMMDRVLDLVQTGKLEARIDSKNMIIKAHKPPQRAALFKEALEMGEQVEHAARALATRIKLIQADLVVRERNQARSADEE